MTLYLVPVVLLPRETLSTADMLTNMTCSYLYHKDGDNTPAVANHILNLYLSDDIDLLFIADQDSNTLVQRLVGEMPLIFAKVITVLPFFETDMLGIPLRFDTKLYMYKEFGIGYTLYETYSVIQKPPVQRVIGNWTVMTGISMPSAFIWERRTDLFGITLKKMQSIMVTNF